MSTDLNQNIESETLISNESFKKDLFELQNKLLQKDLALYKATDDIQKLKSKLSDLRKKNNQLQNSLQHYRQECEKLRNENIEGLNVNNNYYLFFR